jgi:hypothetical protein
MTLCFLNPASSYRRLALERCGFSSIRLDSRLLFDDVLEKFEWETAPPTWQSARERRQSMGKPFAAQ